MAFTFEEFPNSDYYNSDLRRILTRLREIDTRIDSYDTTISELQEQLGNITGLYTRVSALEAATADLNAIRSSIRDITAQLTTLSNKEEQDFNFLYNLINDLNDRLTTLGTNIDGIYEYVDTSIARVEANYRIDLLRLQNLFNTISAELTTEMKEVRELIEELITHLSYDVYNPIDNARLTFDENNKQVYVDLRDDGMSYGELSARQFTYQYIADAQWTHRLFSTKGRRYVTHSDRNMYSPISGRWTNWAEALSHAIGTIFGSINYGQLASEDITYGQLSALTYADLIRISDRGPLTYGHLASLSINGDNLIGF